MESQKFQVGDRIRYAYGNGTVIIGHVNAVVNRPESSYYEIELLPGSISANGNALKPGLVVGPRVEELNDSNSWLL